MERFTDQPKKDTEDIERVTDRLFISDENEDENDYKERSYLEGKEPETESERRAEMEAENLFKPINENGLSLGDLPKNLQEQIESKKAFIEPLSSSEVYSNVDKNSTIKAIEFQVRELEKWLEYINFYLDPKNSDPIRKLKQKIESDRKSINDKINKNNQNLDEI